VLSNRTRRRLDPDTRKEEILKAALDLFAARPADQVSVEEVADAAGVSPGLVHHYFGSRSELVEAALRATATELIGTLTVDAAAPAAAQLESGLTIYLDYLEAHPQSWAALLRAGHSGHDSTAAIATLVDDHAMALAVRAVHPIGVPPVALEVALRGWLALVKDACLRWLDSDSLNRPALQILLATAFAGCLQAAAASDDRAEAALVRFLSGVHP
jgi:AcrR family transcriptional regulator